MKHLLIGVVVGAAILTGCSKDKPESTLSDNAVLWGILDDNVRFDICQRFLETGQTLDGIGIDAAYQIEQCS